MSTSSINVENVCAIAWQLNADIPEFWDMSLTQYCRTPLYATLVKTDDYSSMYQDAFGNMSLADAADAVAALSHLVSSWAPTNASLAMTVIMVLIVLLRLYSRLYVLRSQLRIEDWLIIFGAAVSVVIQGFNSSVIINGGGGKHFYDVSPKENYINLKQTWFITFFYNVAMLPIKMSFLFVYASFYFKHSIRFRWACYSVGAFLIVGNLVFIISSFTWVCQPFDYWEHIGMIWQICPHSDIWDITAAVYNVFTDLVVFILPLSVVLRMRNLTGRDKAALIALFSLGASVCIVSFARIWPVHKYETLYDWSPYGPLVWCLYTLEPVLGVIVACLPMLRVFYLSLAGKSSPADGSSSADASPASSGNKRSSRILFRLRNRHSNMSVKELDINAERTVDRLAGVRSIIIRARWAVGGGGESGSTLKGSIPTNMDDLSKISTPQRTVASVDASMDHVDDFQSKTDVLATVKSKEDDIV